MLSRSCAVSLIGAVAVAPCLLVANASAFCIRDMPGDINDDATTDVLDVSCEILAVVANFLGDPQPSCVGPGAGRTDVNGDSQIDIPDIQHVILYSLGVAMPVSLDGDQDACPDTAEACVVAGDCDDGNPCTADYCGGGGYCLEDVPTDCSDGEACSIDSCDTVSGCVYDTSGCGGSHFVLTGTPNPATVFNAPDQTYFFSNNLSNVIWHGPSNQILAGYYSSPNYYRFTAGAAGYPQLPTNGTGPYHRMVLIPQAEMVAHAVADLSAAQANEVYISAIDSVTGMLGTPSSVNFSDGYNGTCNLLSSSADELLCFDGSQVRHYSVTSGSSTVTFVKAVTLVGVGTNKCSGTCYGGTMGWDGMFYYVPSVGDGQGGTGYLAFDATGALHGTYNASGGGNINSCYFDWSVARYSTHDGFGGRSGGTTFTWSGGTNSNDSHSFSPVSSAHSSSL